MSATYELDRILAENHKLREQITATNLQLGGAWARCTELRKERDFYCNQVIENGVRAQQVIDALNDENDELRELVADMYARFHGVVIENWSYSSEDFYMYEQRMHELGVEFE